MGLPIGGGIGGLVLLLLISALTGQSPIELIHVSSDRPVGTSGVSDSDPQTEFASVVLADTEYHSPQASDRDARSCRDKQSGRCCLGKEYH